MRKLAATGLLALALAAVYALSSAVAAGEDWTWPVRGEVITSYRNGADPYASGQHRGIDVAARLGEPVVAATAGEVRFAGVAGSSGLTVSLRTADGGFDTSYLHLSSIGVKRGQRLRKGERLGAVGTTGRRSAVRPHLHFGVRRAGTRHSYVDPLDFLPSPSPRPAPDAPREAPLPVPAPVRAVPRTAPKASPAPRRLPVPVRAPAPRRVPAPLPRGVPAPAPRGVPSAAPRAAPVDAARRAPAARPAGVPADGATAPAAVPAPLERPGLAPELGVAPHRHPAQGPSASRPASPPASATPDRERRGGLDLGWVLACAGLMAAALAIGRPEGAQAARARGSAAFGALLRPLRGRG